MGKEHTPATAAGRCLHDDGVTDLVRGGAGRVHGLECRRSGNQGDSRGLGDAPGAQLVSQGFDGLGAGADEGYAVFFAEPCEGGALREKTVARM